jgi:hypothetical protein
VTATEVPEIIDPEEKPMTAEMAIMTALDVVVGQMKMSTVVAIPAAPRAFTRPSLSPRIPGMIQPGTEAALSMATR